MVAFSRNRSGSHSYSEPCLEHIAVPHVLRWEDNQEIEMRGMIFAMAAIAGIACAVPASAEDIVVRAPGVAIGVGNGHRDTVVERRVIRDRDYARGNCRTTIIKSEGVTKKIKRCD